MKNWLQKVFLLINRFFLFLRLHIHVEVGVKEPENVEEHQTNEVSDDPDIKERQKGNSHD